MSEVSKFTTKEALRSRKWREEHPEYYKEYLKKYHKEWRENKKSLGLCSRCGNKPARKGKTNCQECASKDTIKGQAHPATMKLIIPSDHPKIKEELSKENKSCALCGNKEHNGKGWNIDHCHLTNRFRGLLCSNCNTGLGQFKDSVALLNLAIAYLKGSSE